VFPGSRPYGGRMPAPTPSTPGGQSGRTSQIGQIGQRGFRWRSALATIAVSVGFIAATTAVVDAAPKQAPKVTAKARSKLKPVRLNIARPTPAPEITPGLTWLNGQPTTLADLKGKVVLVNFWTFACINCQRTLPHVKDLYAKYHSKGFEIIGMHTPEFDYEKELKNVEKAVQAEGITWPVVQDNNFATWKKYRNTYWPAFYYLDRAGKLRHFHAGEGKYAEQDAVVAALLAEPTPS
jgi:thiol-disulfide isomerase/thioredoxin